MKAFPSLVLLLAALAIPAAVNAITFTGTNAPGTTQDFAIPVSPGTTNLAISVNGSAGAYSHLLLKAVTAPSATDYDFIAAQNSTGNAINLELPQLLVTNYVLRVSTPAGSAAHSFTVVATNNVSDLRSAARPATKPIVSTTITTIGNPPNWQYYRVDVPTNVSGWRVTITASNAQPDLYIQRDVLPTSGAFLRSSTSVTNDIIAFTQAELTPGTYFIGVNLPSGSASFTLRTELIEFTPLTWDPGATHLGTEVYDSPNTNGGDHYFRVSVQNTSLGAWRTALNVLSGDANLYLSKGTPPSPVNATYKSERAGSDGFVVPASAFNAGEDWYLLVRATNNSAWNLVTGEPFVTDLGVVATNGSSGSGEVVMGAEGMRFFRTATANDQVAWRLWLNGATNLIYVKKGSVPLPGSIDLSQAGQMLIVPSYLVGGQLHFVSFAGAPGTTNNLDSRAHNFSDLDFAGSTNLVVTGYPYASFRVQVPPEQLAWQVSVVASNGNPNLAVRRNFIPNESNNDAYSEVPGTVTDSITLVPDTLSDGTFYVTIYGTNNYTCTLQSGPPVIPDINYSGTVTNTDTNRVGWSIFKVADINQQLGSLGWDLAVSNSTPGTRIAIRRNRAPGIWNYRTPTTSGSAGFYTLLSSTNFLQAPDNPLDVWYVGVYNPSNALGAFTLVTKELEATPVSFDGGTFTATDVPAGKWQFMRVDVPAGGLGWDVRLTDVTSGTPQLVIRRERLPSSLSSVGFLTPITSTNWLTGNQWAAGPDWTGRNLSAVGNTYEGGRMFTGAMGRPVEPGTYYVGVLNLTGSNTPMSYSILSRGIGTNLSIPVVDIPFDGGSISNVTLAARDIAVFRVNVPTNVHSWKTHLSVSSGDALMALSRNFLPNITATTTGSVTNQSSAGRKVQKSATSPDEYFLQLSGGPLIFPGPHYIVVASEGQAVVTNLTRIGSSNAVFTLTSIGEAPIIDLGMLETNDIFFTNTIAGGDSDILAFNNLLDTLGFELSLPQKTGNPWMVSPVSYNALVNPGSPTPADTYGNEGGADGVISPDIITAAIAFPDDFVAVKARGSGTTYSNASYVLRIRKLTADPLAFDDGNVTVTNQTNVYQFFEVVVPPEAVGWDLRITNVTQGTPKLVVSRGNLALRITTLGWSPGRDTFWPFGANWLANKDWTQRSQSASGANEDMRILTMGMGQPLQPGIYYIGIEGGSSAFPMSYTLVSRGIGSGFAIPVVDVPFAGGIVTNTDLAPREAAYHRIIVPPGVATWQSRLTMTSGEAMLLHTTNWLPNVLSGTSGNLGRAMQKSGNEHYLTAAANNVANLVSGTNYLAVISEGQNATNTARVGTGTSSFVLESRGALDPFDVGTASSGVELRHTNTLEAGEVFAYQFTVPPATTSVEVELLNRTGNPAMVLRSGAFPPNPGAASVSSTAPGSVVAETYGTDGGWSIGTGIGEANTSLITLANPSNGVHTVFVKARQLGSVYTNAAYVLAVRTTSITPLAFDGGLDSVTNMNAGSWRFFEFNIPPNALGWDLRLTNVSGGVPKLVLRRGALPLSLATSPWASPAYTTNWPGTNQWAAAADWTRRSFSADNINEDFRILAMGMGQPLEPGQYFAGVFNSTSSNTLDYTLVSRGIGDGFALPVTELAFTGGSATNLALAPREVAYYRVEVPPGVRAWKVRLTTLSGEALLLSLKDRVPSVDTGRSTGTLMGRVMQKSGNEHFIVLPLPAQTNYPGGTYYLAVVGEGLNPANSSRVGSGVTSFELVSEGEPAITDLGTVGASELTQTNSLAGGEGAFYSFSVPSNILAVELRLENRVGNPIMVLTTNTTLALPDPGGVLGGAADSYGNDGGLAPLYLGTNIITVPNPTPGTYRVAIKARASGAGIYPDAGYTLRVRQLIAPDLNFSADFNTNGLDNSVTSVLVDQQRAYYRVVVPTNVNDQPVIGWELNLAQSAGAAALRVRKDLLPSDSFASGMLLTANAAVIVPPFLTPGNWFVEVVGTNSTTFTLTSSNLNLQRPAWLMPNAGEPVTTPGLSAPEFGDSGVETNGNALPGDQGIDLESGRFHYYAVEVPANNAGLVALQLAAISGNPDLFLRTNLPPTPVHKTNGSVGPILYDRSLTGATTDYGNWVPFDGKTELRLATGTWYLAVRAVGNTSARYRLRLSTGNVTDLDLATGTAADQSVASNNWRYYRFQVPMEFPANWHINFSQQSGDVIMHLRDTTPPGNGVDNLPANVKDWTTDAKNTGPYGSFDSPGTYTFTAQPLRPGSTYYVGFRAKADSTFSITSSVSGATNPLPPEIPFYSGFVTNPLPPNGTLTYRILTPADSLRWRHTSVHSNTVQVYIENGALPSRTISDDFRSASGANSSIAGTYLTAYPWLPLQTYYVVVTNTTGVTQPFSFTMSGSNTNADDDIDLMPDFWELLYFGNVSSVAAGDFDLDGVSNLNEYLEGTNPTNRTSLRPRLAIQGSNGVVNVNPFASNYTSGTVVTLTATPSNGYNFVGWSGAFVTNANPLDLTLISNVTLTARFRVPGDDFDQRIPLTGFNAAAAPLPNNGATKESGEPSHAGNAGGRSLWWTWTAPASGTTTVTTDGSTFRTLLAAYTGTNVAALSLVTNSAAAAGSNGTWVTFNAVANTAYRFAVDGFGSATGTVALALSMPQDAFILTQPTQLTNGFRFNILSAPGLVLRVEAGASFGVWTRIAVLTNATGTYEFTDTNAPASQMKFYRAAVGAGTGSGSTNPPVLSAPMRLPGGGFQFTILGVTERTVRIDAGPNPLTFSPIDTLTNITSPVIFTDTNAASFNLRFYRALLE